MDNFSKERLQLLIEQIQLPETIVHEYFSETTLQKLTVFKETEKHGNFNSHNPKPFPCEVH